MRAILVGSERDRDRLRWQLGGTLVEVVGEFLTIADARASGLEADAIVLAAGRRRSIGPDAAADDQPVEALTARELEVLELLAEGLPNRAIADRLGISDQTVKFHVASISGKLGASNRTDAVRRAARLGLIAL